MTRLLRGMNTAINFLITLHDTNFNRERAEAVVDARDDDWSSAVEDLQRTLARFADWDAAAGEWVPIGSVPRMLPVSVTMLLPPRAPITHELKAWPGFIDAVAMRLKRFEVRKDDRDYQPGDFIILRGWDPETGNYTGVKLHLHITYKLEGGRFGVAPGFCVLSIVECS